MAAAVVAVALTLAGPAEPGLADGAGNEQFAERDAAGSLPLLQLPAGAERADANPATDPSLLESPSGVPATPNAVVRSEFWRVPSAPPAVIAWIKAHRPAGSRIVTEGGSSIRGVKQVWWVGFERHRIRNVASLREISVTVAAADGGGTALRADGVVVWMVPRALSERIPDGARLLDVVLRGGKRDVLTHIVVRDPVRIARAARVLNRLPLAQPGTFLCALDRGARLHLTFRGEVGARPLARAVAELGGCANVRLTLAAGAQPPLLGYGLPDDLQFALGLRLDLSRYYERYFGGFDKSPPTPAAPLASGTTPAGLPYQVVGQRDPRFGVCAEFFELGIRRSSGCLIHPRGRRSTVMTTLSCYPRAVSGFVVLAGARASTVVASYDDGVRVRVGARPLPTRTFRTRLGLGYGTNLVRLPHRATLPLGYRGPVIVGFRRGVHDLEHLDVLGARGTRLQRVTFDHGPFAAC